MGREAILGERDLSRLILLGTEAVGRSWVGYPGVLAECGWLPLSPPRLGSLVAHRGCEVGTLWERCLGSVDRAGVRGASRLHLAERRAPGFASEAGQGEVGREAGQGKRRVWLVSCPLLMRTDASL